MDEFDGHLAYLAITQLRSMISVTFLHRYSTISGIILAILVVIVYTYWARKKVVLPDHEGLVHLKPNLLPLLGGIMFLAIYLGGIFYPLFFGSIGRVFNSVMLGIFLIPVFIMGVINIKHFLFHRVIFNDDFLIIKDRNKKITNLVWNDITNVSKALSIGVLTPLFVKLSTNIYPQYIDPHLVGFKVFEYYLEKNNPDMGLALKWRLYNNPNAGNEL